MRDEILAATEKLLISTGDADRVSIRMISEAVGVTAPSLYMHFPDKDALLFAVCQAQFVRLERAIEAAVRDIDDPVQRLHAMGHTYVRFGVEHPEQYRILLMTKMQVTRDDFEAGTIPGVSAFTQLLRAVEACMDAGAFRRGDAFLVATGLWAVVHGITSLRISMHGFPFVGGTELLDHVLAVQVKGLAP
ncbi:MAG TPA: TetR/AcrR family transcriptional regulator [Acidimicrobiales bacterium]